MPFAELIFAPLHFVLDPTKRIFFLYFISSLLIALFVLYKKDRDFFKALESLMDRRVWLNPSSRLDMILFLMNSVLKSILFFVIIFTSVEVSRFVVKGLYQLFPEFNPMQFSFTTIMVIYSLVNFIVLDFTRFYQHYLFHKIPFLWNIHKVHHTATVLTPITLYRTHPIESVLASIRRITVVGVITGIFIFVTQSKIDAYAILGVNAFDFLFNMIGSNLRHSHVWMTFGKLDYLLISPAQHQIHHSRDKKHHDKNLGFALSIWDQLFGTFYPVKEKEFLIFGVRGENSHSLFHALFDPLRNKKIKDRNESTVRERKSESRKTETKKRETIVEQEPKSAASFPEIQGVYH